jgi:hypothetical protein
MLSLVDGFARSLLSNFYSLIRALACATAICISQTSPLPAQSPGTAARPPSLPGDVPEPDGPTATVTFNSGQSVRARSSEGLSERVGLRKNQVVNITMHYPVEDAGRSILVLPLDGGRITGPKMLTIARDGTIRFKFQIEREPGAYQIMLQDRAQELRLQFWVWDEVHPENNPPTIN